MKKTYRIFSLTVLAASLFTAGCSNDLLDCNPYDATSSGVVWSNETNADQAVLGVYQAMMSSYIALIGGPSSNTTDSWSIEGLGWTTDARATPAWATNNLTPTTSLVELYWKAHYEGIARANDCLVNLPNVPMDSGKKARLIAECKFLLAYYYYRLNAVFGGVPLYIGQTSAEDYKKERPTEEAVWRKIIDLLTDCINEPNLPNKYASGNNDYGRITKGAAYALRGKTYMWTKEWDLAELDFKNVKSCGYSLYQGDYKKLFKRENEQCDEMIFSAQCYNKLWLGNFTNFRFGSHVSYGWGWNSYYPNTDFVDSFEYADGRPFSWDEYFPADPENGVPAYSSMEPTQRRVYFLRNNMTASEISTHERWGVRMDLYLPDGNEERLAAAYETRDPRLMATIITPNSEFLGCVNDVENTYWMRTPYRGYAAPNYDIETDTKTLYLYLYRKFVAEGKEGMIDRDYSDIDVPLIRYADVLLCLAESINEQGRTSEAIPYINEVRKRAGVAELNTPGNPYVQVSGQDDLRKRIQKERRWELCGEAVTYFDEVRCRTLADYYGNGGGKKEWWGMVNTAYSWPEDDRFYRWPIPQSEIDQNSNLSQNPFYNE